MAEVTPPSPSPAPLPAAVVAPSTPVRSSLGLLLPLLAIITLTLLLLAVVAGSLRWLLVSESGTAWLLQRLPAMVQVQGFRGALLDTDWQAERLRVQWDGGRQWLEVEGLQGRGLRWQWRPHAHAWVALEVDTLAARQLKLHTGSASTPGPTPLPETLAPPVQLKLGTLLVQRFVLDGQTPVEDLLATGLSIDPRPGAQHRIDKLSLQTAGMQFKGSGQLGNAAPYPLQAQAQAQPALAGQEPAWAAVLNASGELAQVQLTATLRGRSPAQGLPPALDLRAELQPLQPWPLAGLDLKTQALDLSALLSTAPATLLTGTAQLQGGAGGSPLQARVALDNARPGRWNEGRLPVRGLKLDASGSLQQRDRLELSSFELRLADASANAGTLTGSAVWLAHQLTLETRLQGVTPQRLDGRATAMTLTGPLELVLDDLPSPDLQARSASSPPLRPSVRWKVDLQGLLAGTPQPVQVQLEGRADEALFELSRATAQAGAASASVTARLQRQARGDWQLSTTGNVSDLDPVPWWPGEAGSAWRKGPHRFSGTWQFDVRLPRRAQDLKPLVLAQRMAGNGMLRLHDSMLAGVALSADMQLGYGSRAGTTPASLQAELQIGGNRLRLEGGGNPLGEGQDDRWRVELAAGNLASLGAISRLHPALAAWEPRSGSVQAVFSGEGRWPQMRSEGNATLSQLQLGTLDLARGSARWQWATVGARVLQLQAEADELRLGAQRAQRLRADIQGTIAEHRIELTAALPVLPPPAAERLLGLRVKSGTRALLLANGQWLPAEAGGGRWNARIERLAVGTWDGKAANPGAQTAEDSSWAETRNLQAALDFSAQGELLALQANAGALRLGDALSLRWEDVRADLRGPEPQLQLRATIEPFALAPLLARLQPDMGWQGDLRLAARMDIRAAAKMDAELVFERTDGDLHLAGEEGVQLMGLTDFRLAVSAHEGLWNFTPLMRGRSLGELSGRLSAQTTPERRWPHPEASISGEVRARVADLGIWGAWVPPGWRLAGALESSAKLSGSFGKPLYDGQLQGQGLAVRNLLQGVNISEGQVLVKLAGDTATIERFTLKAGEGTAGITGSATLGPGFKPQRGKLQFNAQRLRVLGRVDRQLSASGVAEATLEGERYTLGGKFRVDEGLFDLSRADAPKLDDDVTVRRPDAPEETRATAEDAQTLRNFTLGLDIDLGDKVRVRGRGVDLGLRGQVRLTNPAGRLAVNGTISSADGTYAAYGQKLEIERGILSFSGPYNNPRLDVLALRPNIDQRVGVAITGNALTPRVRLYAEPELSDSEKLSWLVLGRASDGLGRNDTALLQRAAVALLAGEGEAPTDALMRNLGIDEVSLRQGDGDVRETVITVGKQLSRRWYLGYERGVNATTGTWQLIYRIAQRFTLRAQSGEDSALDLIWTWRLQESTPDAAVRKFQLTPP